MWSTAGKISGNSLGEPAVSWRVCTASRDPASKAIIALFASCHVAVYVRYSENLTSGIKPPPTVRYGNHPETTTQLSWTGLKQTTMAHKYGNPIDYEPRRRSLVADLLYDRHRATYSTYDQPQRPPTTSAPGVRIEGSRARPC
jgi:hypothetical protein